MVKRYLRSPLKWEREWNATGCWDVDNNHGISPVVLKVTVKSLTGAALVDIAKIGLELVSCYLKANTKFDGLLVCGPANISKNRQDVTQ